MNKDYHVSLLIFLIVGLGKLFLLCLSGRLSLGLVFKGFNILLLRFLDRNFLLILVLLLLQLELLFKVGLADCFLSVHWFVLLIHLSSHLALSFQFAFTFKLGFVHLTGGFGLIWSLILLFLFFSIIHGFGILVFSGLFLIFLFILIFGLVVGKVSDMLHNWVPFML